MNVLACDLVPNVTLLTVLALPDPKPHVLPLPLLQTVVRPVAPVLCSTVRPLHSVQLVMVHPAAPREFARTYFGPHRRRRGSPHDITRCRKSSEILVTVNVVSMAMLVVMVMVMVIVVVLAMVMVMVDLLSVTVSFVST